jgi:DNA replication protein DnaC
VINTKACEKHPEAMIETTETTFNICKTEKTFVSYGSCPECEEEKRLELVRQHEKALAEKRKVFENGFFAEIPAMFRSASMSDFPKAINDIACKINPEAPGLLISGKCGTGKTHLAVAVMKKLALSFFDKKKDIDYFFKGEFLSFPDIAVSIKASFSKDGDNIYSILKSANREYLNLYDDICSMKATESIIEAVYFLVNSRYERMLPSIYTTNLSLSEISDIYGDRVASRLSSCIIINLTGEDRRLRKHGNS